MQLIVCLATCAALFLTIRKVECFQHNYEDNFIRVSRNESDNVYLSGYALPYFAALLECRQVFDGRLASILTEEQDQEIRRALEQDSPNAPSTVWTSGRYDFSSEEWRWEAINRPLNHVNWIASFPSPSQDSCITIVAVHLVDSYGWMPTSCGAETSITFRFICQF